jgi:hypothetical protein
MPLESVTPSPSVVNTDIVALHDARRLAATAKPIADAFVALLALLDVAPALQRVVASLQQREADLRKAIEDLDGLVVLTRERTTSEQRRLEADLAAHKTRHEAARRELDTAIEQANDAHAKALGDLKLAREKRESDHRLAMTKYAEDEQRTLVDTEKKRSALTAEIMQLTQKRDGLLIDLEKMKARFA